MWIFYEKRFVAKKRAGGEHVFGGQRMQKWPRIHANAQNEFLSSILLRFA